MTDITLHTVHSIHHALEHSGFDQTLFTSNNAFCNLDFLQSLENSGAIDTHYEGKTGWIAHHFLICQANKAIALVPAYIKTHSWGEYVFDQQWANAFAEHQLDYYPKLVLTMPFTPSKGERLLISQNSPYKESELWALLIPQLNDYCKNRGISGWHLLFPHSNLANELPFHKGVIIKQDCQFHWFNQTPSSFNTIDDFFATFASRKRKNSLKERKKAHNVATIQRIEGSEFSHALLQKFYDCYQMTYQVRGRTGYLSFEFFQMLQQSIPDQLMMVTASQGEASPNHPTDNIIACALFFKDKKPDNTSTKSRTLYGRYWGALKEVDCLHFECCYYQGIEYAIEQGFTKFDPGTQGEHKIARGFTPVDTHSFHHIVHNEFHQAIRNHVERELPYIEEHKQQCEEALPFKKC